MENSGNPHFFLLLDLNHHFFEKNGDVFSKLPQIDIAKVAFSKSKVWLRHLEKKMTLIRKSNHFFFFE